MLKTLVQDTETCLQMDEIETLVLGNIEEEEEEKNKNCFNAEIDTSLPFESVREAVTLFGGSGFWKPQELTISGSKNTIEESKMFKVEEEAAKLQKDLIMKERETLEVLKELESTKRVVDELKLQLKTESSKNVTEKENRNPYNLAETQRNFVGSLSLYPSSSPGLILMELRQAKVNLNRTTSDLAGIRASVDSLNTKIEKERISLKKTRERVGLNTAKISIMEEELKQTRVKLQLAKNGEIKDSSENRVGVSKEFQKLSSEAEKFKQMREAAKSEVFRAMSEIEETKTSMRMAEIRLVAAVKMVEAARATEAAALAEIKAISSNQISSEVILERHNGVTLPFEEYLSLTQRAQEAEEKSKKRVLDVMHHIDEANISKMEVLSKVQQADEELKVSRKLLEKTLNRVESANSETLGIEEALRKQRLDNGQKRRSFHNSTKFKNSYPSRHRKESRQFDLNETNMVSDGSNHAPNQTLSIGQILSRKLLMPENVEMRIQKENAMRKPKVSLAQMLGKQIGPLSPHPDLKEANTHSKISLEKRNHGFVRFSLLTAKDSKKKKKKKQTTRWTTCKGQEV